MRFICEGEERGGTEEKIDRIETQPQTDRQTHTHRVREKCTNKKTESERGREETEKDTNIFNTVF